MYFLLTLLVVFSLGISAHGQTSPEAKPDVEDLLIQANLKKALASREIDRSHDRVANEVARVMAEMDRLFQEQIQELFEAHYKRVEETLQTVSLPKDVGALEVFWQQFKAGVYDSSDLDALVDGFVHRTQAALEPQREDLFGDIDSQLTETLTVELKQAQDNIRAPFQEIVGRYFPVWNIPRLNPPPVPPLPSLQEENRSHVPAVVIGPAGFVLYTGGVLAKETLKKAGISKWLKGKLLGKVASKVVARIASGGAVGVATGPAAPVIAGSLLAIWMAYDIWDATQAKADLENELRTQFLSRYKEDNSPATIWNQPVGEGGPSFRQQLEQQVDTSLDVWSDLSRKEVKRMLTAARVSVLSPNAQEYIAEQTQKGRHTQEIVEVMNQVGEVFGPEMIAEAPLEHLQMMIIHAPDRQELGRLAGELGRWLLQEYTQHGRELLLAANRLGVPAFLEVVQAGKKLDWSEVRAVFERYPADLSERARRGLLLALQERTAPSGVAPATLETIARNELIFRHVAPVVMPDTDKLFRLFGNPPVVDLVARTWQKNAEATQAFLNHWPVRTWEHYREPARFDALLSVAEYRLTQRRQAAEAFAREIGERDELTRIFADIGLCGVQLWDAHVGTAAGKHQREKADEAIRFYKAGYPCNDLLTPEGLEQARCRDSLWAWLACKGRSLEAKVQSLGTISYYGLVLLALLSIAFLAYCIALLAVWLKRKLLAGNHPGPPPSEPTTGRIRQVPPDKADDATDPSTEQKQIDERRQISANNPGKPPDRDD